MRPLALVIVVLTLAGSSSAAGGLAISVAGNRLVAANGQTVRLLGVNRSSFEYACAQGWGLWEGSTDAAAVAAMKAWRINAVRVPLNEACWLGLPTVKKQYRGSAYRNAVQAYVRRLHDAGLYVILDLHWNAPGKGRALEQQLAADADHSPAFWRSVAQTFRADRAVLFDLYNEPHDISWRCWRDGCSTPGHWRTAGMQQLVNAVRATGARQPLLLGGLSWSNDLTGWLRWRPRDPRAQLVASVHVYKTNQCGDEDCWNSELAPVAARVPLVSGEFGQTDCEHEFIDRYATWADAHGVSYLAWAWNVWGCSNHALISSYDGTPTPYGEGYRAHLASLP